MSTAGASHSQSSECQLQKLIPCYFALTSEPNPPLERELCPQQESGANSKQEKTTLVEKAELPHLGQYYGYTLKLVQSGLLILTWGKNENNVAAFYCDKGKFTQISDNIPGLSSGDHYVSVPQCAGETFKVCYLHTLPEERNLAIASWKEIVKNLEGHEWQQITLCEKPYSLHWKDAVPLIEDFRGKRGGKLDFLATWSESKRALNPDERNIFKEKWIAAEDDPLTTRTAAIPEGIPILLHDPVGQIQDCRKAYLLSTYMLNNYCRQHTPLLASGFMVEYTLEGLAKTDVETLQEEFQIKDSMPNAAPSPPLRFVAHALHGTDAELEYEKGVNRRRQNPETKRWVWDTRPTVQLSYEDEVNQWRQSPGGKRWAWDVCQKIKADKTYRPKLPLNSPISFLNKGREAYHILQEEYNDFSNEFEKYQDEVFTNHRLLCNGLKRITAIWHILLSEKNTFSFRSLLTTPLRIDQAFIGQLDETSTIPPLLQLRDLIFCRMYANILDVPMLPSWGISKHAGSARELHLSFQTDVRDHLFNKDDDLKFFCDMFHKGSYPTEAAGKLLLGLAPLFSSFNDSQASTLLAAAAKRVGLELPQVTEMTILRFICCLCLMGGSLSLQVEKLLQADPDDWSILTKTVNACDVLKSPLLEKISSSMADQKAKIEDLIRQCESYVNEKKKLLSTLKILEREITEFRKKLAAECHILIHRPFRMGRREYAFHEQRKTSYEDAVRVREDKTDITNEKLKTTHSKIHQTQEDIFSERKVMKLQEASPKLLKGFFGCILIAINVRNCVSSAEKLFTPDRPEDYGTTLFNALSILSGALSTLDVIKGALFSEGVGKFIFRANIAVSLIATGVEVFMLCGKRDYDAALGMGIIGGISALLPQVILMVAKVASGLALSFTVGALGIAVCIVGACVYYANLDPPLVAFLKNCLWSKERRKLVQSLRSLPTPCLRDINEYSVWRTAINDTVDSLRFVYSLEPRLSYDKEEDILSIKFEAPCGHGARFEYEPSLSFAGYMGHAIVLKENDLLDPPILEAGGGSFYFHAHYRIQKRLYNHACRLLELASFPIPEGLEDQLKKGESILKVGKPIVYVSIRYRFSSDIDYGTITRDAALDDIVKQSSADSQTS